MFKPATPAPPWAFFAERWIPSALAGNASFAFSHEPKPNINGLSHGLMTGAGFPAGCAAAGKAADRSSKLNRVQQAAVFVLAFIVLPQCSGAKATSFLLRKVADRQRLWIFGSGMFEPLIVKSERLDSRRVLEYV